MNDMKNVKKDLHQTIKANKAEQDAHEMALNARIVTKRSLLEAQVARDKALAQVASLELEHKRSTIVAMANNEARLGQAMTKNEALLAELAKWKERSIGVERMLSTERQVGAERALKEPKGW